MNGIVLAVVLSTGTRVVDVPGGRVKATAPAEFTVTKTGIELKLGRLLLALPKLKGRRFSVRTAEAVAAVRGTEFYVDAQKGSTYLCVCEGKIEAKPDASKKEALNLSATKQSRHHAWLLKRSPDGGLLSEKAPMRGHTDEELASLRAP
jgi:hypothetical protein